MRQFCLVIATVCGLCCAAAAARAHDMAFPGPPPGGMPGGPMPGAPPEGPMSGMYPGMQPVYPGAGYPGSGYPGAGAPGMGPAYPGAGQPGSPGDDGEDEDCGRRPDPYGRDEYRRACWSFGAEAVLFGRSEGSSVVLVRTGNQSLAGTTLLTNNDLPTDYEIGPRINAILHDVWCFDLAFSFFSIDHWHSEALATNTGSNSLSLSAPNVLIDASNAARFVSDSDLWSGELNMRFRVLPRLTLLLGGRMFEFNDNLFAQRNLNTNTFSSLYSIDTHNRLVGVQAGVLGSLFQGRCLSLDGVLKLGYFGNEGRNTIENLAGIGTRTGVSVEASDDTTLVELGLSATYRFNSHVKVWLGYDAMWLNGIATAPGQIAGNDAFGLNNTRLGTAGASGVNFADHVRFDGATTGIELTYELSQRAGNVAGTLCAPSSRSHAPPAPTCSWESSLASLRHTEWVCYGVRLGGISTH